MKPTRSARLGLSMLAVPAALVLVATPALSASGASGASGASDESDQGRVQVANTETVQAHLDANGKVRDKRVYEQVAMSGRGKVDLSNPISTKHLRNLDGFGGFTVKNGAMTGSYSVDGERRIRTVSDFTRELPLSVKAVYTLDGKQVKPGRWSAGAAR